MKIDINQEKCLGCGFCKERVPSIFFLDGYAARLTELGENIDDGNEILIRQLKEAAEICPAQTLKVG
ncbi:MAG: ferredoxin [Spirochaetia bacterium]|nr:ferredoxin [Spirochaetia bacterium]